MSLVEKQILHVLKVTQAPKAMHGSFIDSMIYVYCHTNPSLTMQIIYI